MRKLSLSFLSLVAFLFTTTSFILSTGVSLLALLLVAIGVVGQTAWLALPPVVAIVSFGLATFTGYVTLANTLRSSVQSVLKSAILKVGKFLLKDQN